MSSASAQFKTVMGGMESSAGQAGAGIDGAFKTLGVRSGADIRAEIDKIKAAFDSLKAPACPCDVETAAQAVSILARTEVRALRRPSKNSRRSCTNCTC